MKKSTQHLIAEVPRRQTKVELTIGVDLGDVWSHCRERSVPTGFNELRLVAVMAWKRSSVRSRSGPPKHPIRNQQLADNA